MRCVWKLLSKDVVLQLKTRARGKPRFAPPARLDFLAPVGRSPPPELHVDTVSDGARVPSATSANIQKQYRKKAHSQNSRNTCETPSTKILNITQISAKIAETLPKHSNPRHSVLGSRTASEAGKSKDESLEINESCPARQGDSEAPGTTWARGERD